MIQLIASHVYKLDLTGEEVGQVLRALGRQPYDDVAATIQQIGAQAAAITQGAQQKAEARAQARAEKQQQKPSDARAAGFDPGSAPPPPRRGAPPHRNPTAPPPDGL